IGASGISLDTMLQASGDVPAGRKRYRGGRAGADAGSSAALGARIEVNRFTRTIQLGLKQEGAAKSDPGSKYWVNDDPDNAGAGQPGQPSEQHEIQGGFVAGEGINSPITHPGGPNRRRDLSLDDLASEIVERIVPLEPARIARRVGLEASPEVTTAIADY